MLGISTCWWQNRAERGDEIVSDILELGFEGVELEYRITETLYRQMKPRLKTDLKVLSVHNFFPKPEGLGKGQKASGDFFLLSSDDRDERLRAVQYSIRTLEHAQDLEAKAVILHLGRVSMQNPTLEFKELYGKSEGGNDEGLAFMDEQKSIRKARHERHLDAVLFCLDTLNREAEKREVFLAVENRCHLHEIPDLEEIGIILNEFRGGHIRYWHDVGHARAQENMGILRQKDLLEAYSEMLIGIHLHDVRGLDDHLAPGQGEINYEEIKPFVKSSHLKILEVDPEVERRDLTEGIRVIRDLGFD